MPTLRWITPNKPEPGVTTALVMASRLEVRSLKDVPKFFLRSLAAWKQVRTAPGALGASLIADPLARTFWTLSAWETREQLYAYAKAEPHHTIVKGLRSTMRQSVFTFWEVPVGELPITWTDAKRRIAEQQATEAHS
ncbi:MULTISPECIES: DUF3291 domain-containing protein [Streptomyces]|uniref:DUF3291 domain-containing protein n=1 Tax=Streptomyces TaxID=1883 RepID=UPI0002DF90F4|nr:MULTISPECIES: DUF3291 domain-containing protein [Streptomyces]MYS40935.1 DUF3291 domain-containing protein [Streptomyces sp. SID5998]MYX45681.1 DUF3291 domain-containing protein [Streptomyces sp. SID89]NED76912.1 DUF3291 domain-containing protein [Streptomyces sp. SID9944]MBY8869547.1 DUF3291 domain-containing protein [Streptomyces sennicomposti]MYX30423.1 DUF3291 domain-containing protein [Streptomyces sp. SID8381]